MFLNHFPVWSPDGTRIAYIRDRDSSDIQLFIVSSDGSNRSAVTRPDVMRVGYFHPDWSPDGQRLAFVVEEGYQHGRAIYTVAHDGSDVIRLSRTLSGPSWSPDGSLIAFVGDHAEGTALYMIKADGSEEAQAITILPGGSDTWPPSWSPNGGYVLVDCGTVCIVDVVAGEIAARSPLPRLHGGNVGAWSPDGSRIAVLMLQQLPYPSGSVVLYTMDKYGTDVQVVVRAGLALLPENSGWRDVAEGIASCSGGFVVAQPGQNPGLVSDCETLMSVRDHLTGPENVSAVLNWSSGTPIKQWVGVGVGKVCGPTYRTRPGGCEPLPTDFPELRQGPFGFVPPTLTLRPPEFRRVTELDFSLPMVVDDDLYGHFLNGVIPPEIGDLVSLRVLNLGGIGHSEGGLSGGIPPELGMLRELRELDLSGNDLSGDIPVELATLSKLEVLDVGGNSLSSTIPPEFGRLSNLQRLDLGSNQLSGSVPPDLGRLTGLTEMLLSENQLSGEVPPVLGGLARLQKLSLEHNLITGLPLELAGITGLEQLEVSENMLSCLPAELIFKDGLRVDEVHEACPADFYHFPSERTCRCRP